VSQTTTFLLVLLGTVAWFLLPLLPAIRELLWPTDIAPLRVADRDAANVALFAQGFRTYLHRQLEFLPTDTPEESVGVLPDRTPYVRGRRLPDSLLDEARLEGGLDRLVVLTGPATLAGGETFLRELYASRGFAGGPRGVYRAVLGDAGITLGPGTLVLRWVHARSDLLVGNGSLLSGRASADQAIRLGGEVGFDRLGARTIIVAGGASLPDLPAPVPEPFIVPETGSRVVGDHLRVEGDLHVPRNAVLTGNLVVTGKVAMGPGAHLVGSLKAHQEIELGDGARIDGAVVSRTTVTSAFRVAMGGPVVAEQEIRLGPGNTVGLQHRPTSLAARRIELGIGTTIHGLITASEGGVTTKLPE